MRKKLFTAFCLSLVITASFGQYISTPPSPGFGELMSTFANAVPSSQYTDEFKKGKNSFDEKAKTANDVSSASELLVKLGSGIKYKTFNPSWGQLNYQWYSDVRNAKSMNQLAGYLKTQSANIDPKFLGPDWEKIKTTWLKSLDGL